MADAPRRLSRASPAEQAALTDLCLRSKAHWGYDAAFMATCRAELTLRDRDFADALAVIGPAHAPHGMVQVSVDGDTAVLERLFVAPQAMGRGHGQALFHWAVTAARTAGAKRLRIESDPDACGFYLRMGARLGGTAPSGSIAGRRLPLLVRDL